MSDKHKHKHMNMNKHKDEHNKKKPNLWQILVSVLGAIFGVQSRTVFERDFTRGHSWIVYLVVGLIVIILLILFLIGLAKLIIHLAQ